MPFVIVESVEVVEVVEVEEVVAVVAVVELVELVDQVVGGCPSVISRITARHRRLVEANTLRLAMISRRSSVRRCATG